MIACYHDNLNEYPLEFTLETVKMKPHMLRKLNHVRLHEYIDYHVNNIVGKLRILYSETIIMIKCSHDYNDTNNHRQLDLFKLFYYISENIILWYINISSNGVSAKNYRHFARRYNDRLHKIRTI